MNRWVVNREVLRARSAPALSTNYERKQKTSADVTDRGVRPRSKVAIPVIHSSRRSSVLVVGPGATPSPIHEYEHDYIETRRDVQF
jgi:hypothetical protein